MNGSDYNEMSYNIDSLIEEIDSKVLAQVGYLIILVIKEYKWKRIEEDLLTEASNVILNKIIELKQQTH